MTAQKKAEKEAAIFRKRAEEEDSKPVEVVLSLKRRNPLLLLGTFFALDDPVYFTYEGSPSHPNEPLYNVDATVEAKRDTKWEQKNSISLFGSLVKPKRSIS